MNSTVLLACLVSSFVIVGCQSGTTPKERSETASTGTSRTNEANADSRGANIDQPGGGLEFVQLGVPLADANRVVVLFHGFGANKDDLTGFSRALDAGLQATFLFPQAPTSLPDGGYRWFERDGSDFDTGLARARTFVRWASEQAPQAGLVIGGFSQGAMITANLVADAPPRTEAALVFSASDRLSHPPSEGARSIRVFISHGTQDQVIPFTKGQKLLEQFRSAGLDTTWIPFEGAHRIPRSVLLAANTFLAELGP